MQCKLLNYLQTNTMINSGNKVPFIKKLSLSFGLVFALFCTPLWAVNFGQVQMLSGLGQPLVAEIPIYETDDLDLQSLTVQMASDSAFSRLGIDSKPVKNVQLAIVTDKNGNKFVQLKSDEPYNEPVLSVLLDAKWGADGRLVKELTALVDPPYIAKTAVQTITAPTVVLSPEVAPASLPAEIVRTPTIATGSVPSKSVDTQKKIPAPETVVAKKPASKPALETKSNEDTVTKQPVIKRSTVQPVQIPATASNQLVVQKGDNLSKIAGAHQQQISSSRISLSQMMLAIQRANTNAFINGNPNLLKSGSVLRMPDEPQILAMMPEDSANLLQTQWAKKVNAQPAPVLDAANKLSNKSNATKAVPSNSGVNAPVNQGRLKIVPTVGNMNNAGSQSGASKSGQGQELRVDNTLSQEEIATRQAEIGTLKNQLGDAVKLQVESKRLIELQNSQIKLLTQRMQELEKGSATTTQQSSLTAAPSTMPKELVTPWYLSPFVMIAGLLLTAAFLGFLLKKKK